MAALLGALLAACAAAAAQDPRVLLPGAAHTSGAASTTWMTDVAIFNPGDEAAQVEIALLARGRSNPDPQRHFVEIPGGGSLLLPDIVRTLFGSVNTAGCLVLTPDRPILASARTFTRLQSEGSYGQFIAGVPVARRHGVYQSLLPQLTDDALFRTNLGLVNLGYDQLEAWVAPIVFNGENPKPRIERVPAAGALHISGRLAEPGAPVSDAMVLVDVDFLPGPHFAWASVVDNATGDAIFIPPVAPSGGPHLIPAAAHLTGHDKTLWRTDLEIVGDPFLPVTYELEWWPEGGRGESPEVVVGELEPGEARRYPEVVASVFDSTGAGAILVRFTQGEGLVTSRTYAATSQGTYGQFIPAASTDDAIQAAAPAWLDHLRAGAFHTNLGVVNSGDIAAEVEIEFLAATGTSLGALRFEVPAHGYHQVDRVLRRIGADDQTVASAQVRNLTPDTRVHAWASVVDPRSRDPYFVPARRPVTHD